MDDFRLSIRALRASPVVSLVAVLSLALGIGANTAIFSLVNALLLRQLPVVEPDRLATISSDRAIHLGFNAGLGWNYPMWDELRKQSQPFAGALAWSPQRFNLAAGGGETQPVDGLVASGEYFTTLGVKAALGRIFTVADDVRGGGPDGPVAVISDGLWRRRFGADPGIIGKRLVIESVPLTIVGVTPPGFLGLDIGRAFDVAIPLGTEPVIHKGALIDQPRSFLLFVMLRLKPGQSVEAATAALRAMQPHMHGPLPMPSFAREPFTLVPAGRGTDTPGSVRQRYERPLLTVFVVVALVLLIACGNIANLLLARAAARRHELSVRMALGAPRWRLARQFLVESLVLAAAGAAAGLALTEWGSRALIAQVSAGVSPVALNLSIDWRVFGFASAMTFVTAVLFGTAPALRAAAAAPIDAMKEYGRGAMPGAARGLSGGLVIAQVALSLVLVVAAGLFLRTFAHLVTMPLGFDPDRVLVVTVDTARAQIEPADRIEFFHRLVAAVGTVPGVVHAAASTSTPLSAGLPAGFALPGASIPESERVALWNAVTPEWFAAYGTDLREGRAFDERDTAAGQPVMIVNEAFARRFFPGRRAVGETVSSRTIVGVAGDQVMQGGYKSDGASRTLRDGAPPAIYVPLAQSAGSGPRDRTSVILSVRGAAGPPAAAARSIAAALSAVDPNLAFAFRPLAQDLNASLGQERMVAGLSGFFGVLALLLAGLGLYGLTSYAVSRQRTEIAIRLALGAPGGGVVRLVLRRVAVLVAVGIAAGVGLSLWVSRFVATLLYGLDARDPVTLAGAALILAAVGATAGWLPARHASRIDPLEILRST